jgi:hypothetical protein
MQKKSPVLVDYNRRQKFKKMMALLESVVDHAIAIPVCLIISTAIAYGVVGWKIGYKQLGEAIIQMFFVS